MKVRHMAVIVLVVACSGGETPVEPAIKANATYQGSFASGAERGTISMTAGSPATGSLSLEGASAVALSGTYTVATSAFALSGGGFRVQAIAASNGTASGLVTGVGISGTGTMAAVESALTTVPTRYCGVFLGDDSGMLEVVVSGSTAAASVTGMGGGYTLTGTATSTSATMSVTGLEPGSGRTNTITANLVISGSNISGTGSSTLYPAERVTVSASSTGCAATPPSGPFTAYTGLSTRQESSGRLQVVPGSPASGTLIWGGATITLAGTYTAGAFALTGGAFTISATTIGASLVGAFSYTQGASTLTGGKLAGLGSSATSSATRFCGTFLGRSTPRKIELVTSGKLLIGVFEDVGIALPLTGTADGEWVYATYGANLYVAGKRSGTGFAGTWTNVDNTTGTWTVSAC